MRNAWLIPLVALVACQKPAAPASEASPTPLAAPLGAPAATPPTPGTPPPGHEAMLNPRPQAIPVDLSLPAAAGGLTWKDVAPLVRRQPKSNMRAAEYGVQGDETSELSVFYFGPGEAGGVEPNISRWLGQFTQADGSDTTKTAKRAQKQVGGITVFTVEAQGTYAGGMAMPGAPSAGPAADSMLLGAIAQGPNGAVFFKLVGPKAAAEKARPGFAGLIDSLHAEATPAAAPVHPN